MDAKNWIKTLGLTQHPEGGYFREVYRSKDAASARCLPSRYHHKRDLSTAIYFLLEKEEVSHFHRLKSDEIWHYYDGSPLTVYFLDKGRLTVFRLGKNPEKGQLPMLVIPEGTLFAAEVENKRLFSLIGCTVSPGFDFEDFEMPPRSELSYQHPEHLELVKKFTKA